MKVHFITPTKLSFLDISSMGDSSKRDNPNTIGQFDSGFNYCITLLLRDLTDISIQVKDNYEVEESFTFGTENVQDASAGKSKELITITDKSGNTTVTGFAKALGFNWHIWMALRELWSNMLDEGGYVVEGELEEDIELGTVITLEFFEMSNAFYNVWENRHLYINMQEPLFDLGSVKVLDNPEKVLRIYKNNILVYENLDMVSQYCYNLSFGEIDERRILSNMSSIKDSIASKMLETDNEEFVRTFIKRNFEVDKNDFLYSPYVWYSPSDTLNKVATEVYEEFGEVSSYDWIMSRIRERKDCKIDGKVIKTVEDSLWSYSTKVSVESAPKQIEKSFAELIKEVYDFNLDVEVKTAKLRGSKAVADKFENCILVDESFNVEEDFHTFLVEYFDLTEKGNVIVNLSKYICKLLKR